MDRRKFIQKGALTGSFLSLGGLSINAMATTVDNSAFAKADTAKHHFNLKYAPHIGMFKHEKTWHDHGGFCRS